MMVPEKQLIRLTALIVLPAAALSLMADSLVIYAATGVAILSMAVVFDAVTGAKRLGMIRVSSSGVHRMAVGKPSSIPIILEKPGPLKFFVRLIPLLPESIPSGKTVYPAVLDKDRVRAEMHIDCRPHCRGRWEMTACYLELRTPLGFWTFRRKMNLQSEIRVYPDLSAGRKQISGLINRKDWGLRHLRKIGKGREFEQLREYMPGDSYEDIDWKATARRRRPISRDYEVERSQEIYVILDASRLSTRDFFPDRVSDSTESETGLIRATTIFEQYIIAAFAMAMAAEHAEDQYGLLMFSERPEVFIKAGRGRSHYNACREALYNRMPRNVSPDFEELFAFIGSRIRKRALLVFLTHLDDPLLSENFIRTLETTAGKHVVMVNMMRPPGAYPLFREPVGEGMEQKVYEKLVGHMIWSSLGETRRKLRRIGAGFTLLNPNQYCSRLIGQYRDIKQRQIL